MESEIIASIIGAIATIAGALIGIGYLVKRNGNEGQQNFKIVYYKVLHMSLKSGGQPKYIRHFERLGNEPVEVYDEYTSFSINYFKTKQAKHEFINRSSGIASTHVIFPWTNGPTFTDINAQKIPGMLHQLSKRNSNIYASVFHGYNGLQPGNEDLSVKAVEDTQTMRLVADFSSVPELGGIKINLPQAFFITADGVRKRITAIELSDNVFTAVENDVKANEVIRMEFEFDRVKMAEASLRGKPYSKAS